MNNKAHLRPDDYDSNGDIIPMACKEESGMNNDLRYHGNPMNWESTKGEYEFIEILAQNMPDDICPYPEYKGKPCYSIHCKRNGEDFVGFCTYSLEVLSRDLKEYFMKGGAE